MPFKCNQPAVASVQEDDAVARITRSYQRPAGIEHDLMNGSDHPIAFVEIEIKRPEALAQA